MTAPGGAARVTVILPVRNEERHLEACLDSVLAQDWPGLAEVLVADGRSEDRTRDVVARVAARDPRVRLVDNPGRIVPTAMNAAIAEATGDLIVRVDGHASIPPDYVRRVVESFARSGADCVGGRMEAEGEGTWGRVIARVTSHPFGVGGARFHYSGREGESDTVYLGAYRAETLRRLGLYDPRFVRNQDDELNYRLRARGGKVWFDPAIRARYVARGTLGRLFSQYRQYGFWKVRVYRKHPRQFHGRHAVPALFVAAAVLPALALPWFPLTAALAMLAVPAVHLCAGTLVSRRAGWDPDVARRAPVAFLVLHAAYGLGLWQGIADGLLFPGRFRAREKQGEGSDPRVQLS